MIPDENRSSLDRLKEEPNRLRKAVEKAGELTAWSQLRGARYKPEIDRWPDLQSWVSGPAVDAILAAAIHFTERTNRDHHRFQKDLHDRGGVSASLEVMAN
jgi:hypothetical protein